MSNKELKPCPFCGGEAELYYYFGSVWVHCTGCDKNFTIFDTEKDAIKAWNTRNYPEKQDGSNSSEIPNSSKVNHCKDENATCKKNLQLTRSDIEKMVKPIEWYGWNGKLEAFSFSIIENEMSAFEVCFGKDCLNGHYIDTSSTIDGAKSLAQAFLVDLICSSLGLEE